MFLQTTTAEIVLLLISLKDAFASRYSSDVKKTPPDSHLALYPLLCLPVSYHTERQFTCLGGPLRASPICLPLFCIQLSKNTQKPELLRENRVWFLPAPCARLTGWLTSEINKKTKPESISVSGVGLTGLEPVTLRLSSACSNQLSYRPGLLEVYPG